MDNLFAISITIIENGLYTLFYSHFFTHTKAKKITAVILCFILLNTASFLSTNVSVSTGFISFITVLIGACSIYFCSDHSVPSSAVIGLFPDLITALINSHLSIILSFLFFGRIDFNQLMNAHGTWIIILSKILQALAFYWAARYLSKMNEKLSSKELILIALMLTLSIIGIDAVESLLYLQEFNGFYLSTIIVVDGIFSVLLIFVINMIVKRNETEKLHEMEKQLMESQIVNARNSIASENELHRIKHDVQHLLSSLPESVSGQPEALKLQNQLRNVNLPVSTICTPIDTVLNIKREQASAKGIQMICLLNIIEKPKMSDDDLYVLLINLLDNAIEHNGSERTITVEIKCTKEFLLIRISNSIDISVIDRNGKIKNRPSSVHGYGIKTINTIVRSYSGHIKFEEENHMFIVSIIIS